VPDPTATAPFWANADSSQSSLQITAIVAATALRVADGDRAVADHPWLARAAGFCLSASAAMNPSTHAMELAFAVRFLDAAAGRFPEATAALDRLRPLVPPDGLLHVAGGADEEYMRPLDFAPFPGGPARNLFGPGVVDAELQRLAAGQQGDGGWTVDFQSYSPAATLDWRGHATVNAVVLLRANGVL
jgi:hypothetical protein